MLGKLIVWAQDREHAVARMRYALEETVILGIGTNQSYLHALTQHPQVMKGDVSTGFLGKEFADFAPVPTEAEMELWSAARKLANGGGSLSQVSGKAYPSPWNAFAQKGLTQ